MNLRKAPLIMYVMDMLQIIGFVWFIISPALGFWYGFGTWWKSELSAITIVILIFTFKYLYARNSNKTATPGSFQRDAVR